ncbi:ASCH domain-containing protein [Companilactobacillus allii]|uniref:RNA-binding protein n=1 Tax=Companilactobacillus allii TaxID=1847728 RepID=A0A1P8Q3L8_9LACO|nr:ASCH domain-containing protein [Companilactobacillus allii]APX72440.1 RNA-binding protein [Companilactobacillus allii]USQ69536.1 ASCH domain-containing protein [Companilactobacillus allii]
MDKKIIKAYWDKFLENKSPREDYPIGDITIFGGDPKTLANLVDKGIKTATTSAYDLYTKTEYMPTTGDYNIILDDKELPVCITKTLVTEIVPFKQVSAEHAYHEGEGDRSLKYWRVIHEDFFTKEYLAAGKEFNDDIPCLCEVFEKVYDEVNGDI